MLRRNPALVTAVITLSLFSAGGGAMGQVESRRDTKILAHYMPWFVAKPTATVWGWHWTMNAFDPEKIVGEKRPIASHYYPLIGPYDSGDPAVVEYHLLLMKVAGCDGIIVDWYGLSDLFDYPILHRNTAALFPAAARIGLVVGICYEDQTIPKLVEAGKIGEGARVTHAQEMLHWLRRTWFKEASYLRLDELPVLLSFGSSGLTDDEWEKVLSGGDNTLVYLSEHRRRSVAAGAFDWPVPKEELARLEQFATASKGWPVAMPAAFPRFHDIYAEAKVHPSYGSIADDDGRTFAMTLQRALTSGAALVQVVTWNDWGEGTAIEPSKDFGYRDLETLQRFRRELIDPDFARRPDELRMVRRLYLLRQKEDLRPGLSKQLDEISELIANGRSAAALPLLNRAEAGDR
jgi:hypothetical protein